MTYMFGDMGITTWSLRDGQQVWRARMDQGRTVVEFIADRFEEPAVLYGLALLAAEKPVEGHTRDLLVDAGLLGPPA